MNFIDAFISMAPLLITILMLLFTCTFIMDIIIHYSEKNGYIPIAVYKGLNDRGILELESDMGHGQNGIVSGGNKVTKKELLEQLEELRNQVDTLNAKIKELDENTEPNTRTKPMEGRPFNYIYANREIEIHQEDFFDKVFDVSPTKTRVSIGNYFKSEAMLD